MTIVSCLRAVKRTAPSMAWQRFAARCPPLMVRTHAAVGLAVLARGMHATKQPLCAATTTESLRSIAAHSGGYRADSSNE